MAKSNIAELDTMESEISEIEESNIFRKLLDSINQIAEDSEIIKNPFQKKVESKTDEMIRDLHYELISSEQQLKAIEAAKAITKGCNSYHRDQFSKDLGKVRNEQKSRLTSRHEPDFNLLLIINSLLIPVLVLSFYGKDFAGKLEGGLTATLINSGLGAYMYWDLRKRQKHNQKFDFLAEKVQDEFSKNP
jgi:hypothetical protein